jgi:hypothetical protein
MNTILRLASLTALTACAGLFANGCIVSQCEDENGNKIANCTQFETPTKYVASDVTETLVYQSGYDLVVDSVNGRIDVERHSGSDVRVTFKRHTLGGNSEADEEQAKDELQNDIHLEANDDGRIFVKTSRSGGSSALSADIIILLPDAFDGAVVIDQNNGFVDVDLAGMAPQAVKVVNDGAGDIRVWGARGKLDLVGDFDIDVSVAEWSDEDGQIITNGGTGDLTITVPASAHGSIQATASDDGEVLVISPLLDWNVAEAAYNSKTVTFGDGSGGVVQAKTKATGLGSVRIQPAL